MAEVVDVLAGARKVSELEHLVQLSVLLEVILEDVFNGLDVVVRGLFDLLDLQSSDD